MPSDHCRDILVVSESNEIRVLLNDVLGSAGYELRFCGDAAEACRAIESKHPKTIISSWQMPDVDGFGLCRCIRQFEREGYLYFILIADHGECFSLAKTGVDDFVSLPVDHADLLERVRRDEGGWIWSGVYERQVIRQSFRLSAELCLDSEFRRGQG